MSVFFWTRLRVNCECWFEVSVQEHDLYNKLSVVQIKREYRVEEELQRQRVGTECRLKCKLQWSSRCKLTTRVNIITKVLSCNEVDEEREQSVAPPTSSHCCCLSALPTLTPGGGKFTLTPGGDKFTPAPRWDPLVLGFNLGSTYTQCEDLIMETNLHLHQCGIPLYTSSMWGSTCTKDPLIVGVQFRDPLIWKQIYTWVICWQVNNCTQSLWTIFCWQYKHWCHGFSLEHLTVLQICSILDRLKRQLPGSGFRYFAIAYLRQ